MTEQEAPSFAIEKLYVKDLSLEVPNAPAIYLERETPEISLHLQTGAQKVGDDIYEVTLTATVNAKIGEKYFPVQLGVLKAGAAADIIVMDYKPFTPFSDENIDGHMIFGMTGRQCQTTIAAGKVLMKDRVLVNIDEEAENAHILEAAKKLWGDLNHRVY